MALRMSTYRSFGILLAGAVAAGCLCGQTQQTSRPMFLTGNVAMADGTPLPEPVPIVMECQGERQPQGRTDANGDFGFQIGMNRGHTPNDAAQRAPSISDDFGGPITRRQQILGTIEYSVYGCAILAVLDGYSSSAVELSGRRAADNSEIGTIVLTRLGAKLPATVSVTSLQAPASAKRAYERASRQIESGRFEGAEQQLTRAVRIYPEYADAWLALGVAQRSQGKLDQAHDSFERAIAVDNDFVVPYLYLSLMAARASDWPETSRWSDALLELDPDNLEGLYFNAVAYYNLGNFSASMKSAEAVVAFDTGHEIPLAEQLLAILVAQNGDFERAADLMRSFISHAPPDYRLRGAERRLAQFEQGVRPDVVPSPPSQPGSDDTASTQ